MNIKYYIIFFGVFFVFTKSEAQSIDELKRKKIEIEKEINSINKLIDKTESETSNSLSNIKLAKRKIDLKNKLIKELEQEEKDLTSQVIIRNRNIDSLKSLVSNLKVEYKKIIIYESKMQDKNRLLLLIFSSKDFNQAYKRIKFCNQLFEFKRYQVNRLKLVIEEIKSEKEKLNGNIESLNQKQKEKSKEIDNLKVDQKKNEQRIKNLTKQKSELLKELEKQKRISDKLTDEIKRLIEEEARKITKEKNSQKRNINLALSNNFKENSGKFLLPVENGIITGTYGESFHPVLKDIKIKNNGIDITISKKSDVYAVFKGEVRKIFKVPGSNLAIIIRHGNYLTVYSNLSVIVVNVGQTVETNQKIGEINIQKNEERNILHFELLNESKTEDPLKWIIKN